MSVRRHAVMPIAPTEIVRAALGLLGRHWASLAQALVVPATCMAVLDVFWPRIVELGSVTLGVVIGLLLLVVFAVSCHRILLLEQAGLPNRWGIYFTAREGRFLGWSMLIGLLQVLLAALSVLPLASIASVMLPDGMAETEAYSAVFRFAMFVPGWYIMARFGLVLPATALDQRPTLAQAWRASSSNGWRLAVALALPAISLWGIAWLLNAASGDEPNLAWSFLFAVGLTLLGSIEVAVLSVSFRVLGPLPPAEVEEVEGDEFPPASELACLSTEGPWDAQEIAKTLSAEGIPSRVDSYPPATGISGGSSSYTGHPGFATTFGVYVLHSDFEQAATTLDARRIPLYCGECELQIEKSDLMCPHCGADLRSAAV